MTSLKTVVESMAAAGSPLRVRRVSTFRVRRRAEWLFIVSRIVFELAGGVEI